MKSGISSIFAYLVFCTHLVQIRVLDFLLESSAYQPFSLILQFELHGFRLNIKGTIVVADALNCQKETAEIIVDGGGDYLLCVKPESVKLKLQNKTEIW